MRGQLFVFVIALAAGCHGAKPASPAWPAASTTAEDGGESIDPHPMSVASSVERSADDEEDEPEDAPAADAAKPAASEPEKPATISPPTQPSDDVIMSEEIIIEIDD